MPTLPSRETLRTILSSPQAARTELQRRRVPTGTDGDLLAFVEETFGLRIPAVACCPGHVAPAQAFCDAYFNRAPVAVWKASRGFGGKSTLLATLALTEAITRPADVTVLRGSAQQSERVLEAMTLLWRAPKAPAYLLDSPPAVRKTRFVWGNTITALPASQTAVRGPHPQRLRIDEALLRGSKTDPQRPLPTDPLTTDSVRRRPTTLSHLIEDVTCEDGLRLLPRPTARSKALPDDQLVPEEGVLHTGLLMVARVLLPLSPSSLLHLSDRAVARGRSWSPSRHGGCPGRWNDDRRATRTRSLVDATRVVGRVRREAGDIAFDLVDQIEGRRRVVNMPAGQGVSDDHARSVDAQMKRLPAAYTASAMFHGRPFTFTHSREPGTVDDEMYACARGEAAKCKVEVLTTP